MAGSRRQPRQSARLGKALQFIPLPLIYSQVRPIASGVVKQLYHRRPQGKDPGCPCPFPAPSIMSAGLVFLRKVPVYCFPPSPSSPDSASSSCYSFLEAALLSASNHASNPMIIHVIGFSIVLTYTETLRGVILGEEKSESERPCRYYGHSQL